MKTKKPTNTNHEKCKWLVENFVKKENINWAREIKMAQKFLKENDDIDFWKDILKQFKSKLPSMSFFLTEDGKEIIKREQNKKNLVLPEKISYNIEIEKDNNSVGVKSKSRLLKFLD